MTAVPTGGKQLGIAKASITIMPWIELHLTAEAPLGKQQPPAACEPAGCLFLFLFFFSELQGLLALSHITVWL